MARVILTTRGEDVTIGGSDVDVFGTTTGSEVIAVIDGDITLDASFNVGGDRISLPGTGDEYVVTIVGSRAVLTRDVDGDGVIDDGDVRISIPLGTNENILVFRDGEGTPDDDRRTISVNDDGDLQIGAQIVEDGDRIGPFGGDPPVQLVSVAEDGTQANESSFSPVLSADGTRIAFVSSASNLVPGDTNGFLDVFVVDVVTGDIVRVSVAEDGAQANGDSLSPSISADGTIVAFSSLADNLVAGDDNGVNDAFVANLLTGEIVRISVPDGGTQAIAGSGLPTISADGTVIAFVSADNLVASDDDGLADVFVTNLLTGEIVRVSEPQNGIQVNFGVSSDPSISADGDSIAFASLSGNLVPGDTNYSTDIFVYDLTSGEVRLVSVGADGAQADGESIDPSLSADGSTVAFVSSARNLVPGDTNEDDDIFVLDLLTGEITRISVGEDGVQANGDSFNPSISADGSLVAFASTASNLVDNDTNQQADFFVYDLQTGEIRRIAEGADGTQESRLSVGPSLSADGSAVAFTSSSSDLVPDDFNSAVDVFLVQIESSDFNMV